ncbi:hypothetical protein Q5752_003979 [Cryptotrichosporon argae]
MLVSFFHARTLGRLRRSAAVPAPLSHPASHGHAREKSDTASLFAESAPARRSSVFSARSQRRKLERRGSRYAGWVTGEYAAGGAMSPIDVQYVNALLAKRAETLAAKLGQIATQSGADDWVVGRLAVFLDEAMYWVFRGALLRPAIGVVLDLLSRTLRRFHDHGMDASDVVVLARYVRGVLRPDAEFEDEYV